MSRSINSASQIRIILLLFAGYLIWCGIDSARNPAGGADTAPRIEKSVAKISSEINKHLPYSINSETRLESTRPGKGKSIVFEYTLIHVKKAEKQDFSANFSKMRQENINKYWTEKSLKPIRDLGLTMRHKFSDQTGNFLGEYEVGPSDLR